MGGGQRAGAITTVPKRPQNGVTVGARVGERAAEPYAHTFARRLILSGVHGGRNVRDCEGGGRQVAEAARINHTQRQDVDPIVGVRVGGTDTRGVG